MGLDGWPVKLAAFVAPSDKLSEQRDDLCLVLDDLLVQGYDLRSRLRPVGLLRCGRTCE